VKQWIEAFNARLAKAITKAVGTMACAYCFTALALVSLPAALATRNTVVIVGWIAQTLLQLVLLSVIIVGQNLTGARTEAVITDSHDRVVAMVGEVADAHHDTHELVVEMQTVLESLHATVTGSATDQSTPA
jgi:hypothetical protein